MPKQKLNDKEITDICRRILADISFKLINKNLLPNQRRTLEKQRDFYRSIVTRIAVCGLALGCHIQKLKICTKACRSLRQTTC